MSSLPGYVLRSELASELRDALLGVGEGDTQVLDADVAFDSEDADAVPALHILLFLPRPDNRRDGWDVEKTQSVKREARRLADRLLAEYNSAPPGLTVVSVTTKNAREQDIAAEETPEQGEGVSGSDGVGS
jgi:hypothetical protein